MKKKFNTTGICYPEQHYMMDVTLKLIATVHMIEDGDYFVINRPRQYGKTTMLYLLEQSYNRQAGYIAIRMSFQGIDESAHHSTDAFAEIVIQELQEYFEYNLPDLDVSFVEKEVVGMKRLSKFITKLVNTTNKKLILLIDEVDASSQFDAFLNFLAMLRTKYLARFSPQHATFQSVILAGVHDIKTLKYKIRNEQEREFNSPWNIAADYKVNMSFSALEIVPMLQDYSQSEEVKVDVYKFAKQLFYYTSGYPFLVSKLCKIIAEDILPNKKKRKKKWEMDDLEQAVQMILKYPNPNFDSLIKKLENDSELYDLTYRVIIEGERVINNPDVPIINLGQLYGIFKSNGHLKIHNRIYEQRIYNYMTIKTIVEMPEIKNYSYHFLLENNALDMPAVLLKFQQFMKEQHSHRTIDFLEEQGRLIFLAFLAPILNGQGYTFKEVQTSLEKRLDVVITYFQHRYIIELKRWYGEKAHQKGLDQLADYLDIHGVNAGFLVIFDGRKEKGWREEKIIHQEKEIFAVWV